ncbi:hypothetical protein BH24ACT26_BH24ACT26_17530 [soil metagenome]
MIISRTPLRISLVGGGTDLPSFCDIHGGAVVSTAVDRSWGMKRSLASGVSSRDIDELYATGAPTERTFVAREGGRDVLGQVMRVDHDPLETLIGKVAEMSCEKGLAAYVHQHFGCREAQGSQTGSSAGREYHRVHRCSFLIPPEQPEST